MLGQVNVDYAIAVGVFITGVTIAIALSTVMLLPFDNDVAESLETEASLLSERFSEEVSWSIDQKNVYYNKEEVFISVIGVEPGEHTVFSGESVTGSDVYHDRIVFRVNGSNATVLNSDIDTDQEQSMSIGSDGFSNSVLDAEFTDNGLENVEYNGLTVLESLQVEDNGVEEVAEGDVSGFLNYGSQNVFFYGGSAPDFYFESTGLNSSLNLSEEFDEAMKVESGEVFSLPADFSGTGPVIFTSPDLGVGVSGPGTEYSVSGYEVDTRGSYYVHGFEDEPEGVNRAEANQEFPRTVETDLEGVNRSQVEELFELNSVAFQSRVGANAGYNITFDGMEAGNPIPERDTVVSRSFEKPVLNPDGSFTRETLEVRIWL